MPPDTATSADASREPPVLATLRRFLPYLWPAGQTEAKVRIVVAGLIVLASKGVQLSMGFLYGAAIDRMAPGMEDRKSTRLNPVTNSHIVCRLLLDKKKEHQANTQ